MKKFLLTLILLATFSAVQSQIIFQQGYFIIDNESVSIYNYIQYSLNIQDSTIILPTRIAHIDSTETTSEGLKLYLDNGDIARYKVDPIYGSVFYMIWSNGRLVLWTNILPNFDVNLKQN